MVRQRRRCDKPESLPLASKLDLPPSRAHNDGSQNNGNDKTRLKNDNGKHLMTLQIPTGWEGGLVDHGSQHKMGEMKEMGFPPRPLTSLKTSGVVQQGGESGSFAHSVLAGVKEYPLRDRVAKEKGSLRFVQYWSQIRTQQGYSGASRFQQNQMWQIVANSVANVQHCTLTAPSFFSTLGDSGGTRRYPYGNDWQMKDPTAPSGRHQSLKVWTVIISVCSLILGLGIAMPLQKSYGISLDRSRPYSKK